MESSLVKYLLKKYNLTLEFIALKQKNANTEYIMAIKDKEHQERIKAFLKWFENCKGSEKGEGQIFFDRLFQAFGNTGVVGAGAVCEKPVKKREGKGTAFADLVWKPRVIIELKKRGTPLQKHYDQDEAVYSAYGFRNSKDTLDFLLQLNLDLAKKEALGERITGPGLPQVVKSPEEFITQDYISL